MLSNDIRRKQRFSNSITYACLVVFAVVAVLPFFWLISSSLRNEVDILRPVLLPPKVTLESFQYMLKYSPFITWFYNSVMVSLIATAISVFIAGLAAYSFSRFASKMKKVLSRTILFAYMFPGVLMILPLFVLFVKCGLLDSRIGLIIAYATSSLPFSMWLLTAYYESIPQEIDQAARIDGASNMQLFWRIIVPIAKPGLATTAIFTFINAWNEFLLALTLINSDAKKTLSVGLYAQMGDKAGETVLWNVRMASAVLVILPIFIIFLVLNRKITQGLTAGAVKG